MKSKKKINWEEEYKKLKETYNVTAKLAISRGEHLIEQNNFILMLTKKYTELEKKSNVKK